MEDKNKFTESFNINIIEYLKSIRDYFSYTFLLYTPTLIVSGNVEPPSIT